MKLSELLRHHKLSITDALEGDLRYLIKESVGIDPRVLLQSDTLTPSQIHDLSQRIIALKAGQPLAYVLGCQPFLELSLQVSPDVLIPRSETEQWVRTLLLDAPNATEWVLDIGTGSGCIALALKYYRPQWHVWACDSSKQALMIAESNAKQQDIHVHFQSWDLYCMHEQAEALAMRWNRIVSNPPYVTEQEWLEAPALHAEPKAALVDEEGDGLSCYRAILKYAKKTLQPGGELWLEHGMGQRAALIQETERVGMHVKFCYDDDGRRERVIVCTV